ncbi:SEL1-like repeat protein [Paraglaciecola chathamensis]|uniref:Sel1 repeat family protein n=1 Tax=Paraglaciecola chathamensis S18K6 TaxID=1127672 RepID=A0AAV3UUC0_9ALTE|nr:sel1 repeat family protein [Paraglaciecola chathamensis]GAC08749.1 hypothetical protein GCHA_0786 [Paraglaciecola chathamensis S18K6]
MLKLSLLFILSAAWLFTGRSDMACYLTFLNAQASLNEQAANHQATFHYLYKAYLVGDPTALSRLSQQAIKQKSGYWLHFAKLAGSPKAQRYFSDLQGNTKQSRASIKVLSYAAQQDDIDAQVALYHHFVVKNQRQKAQYWLTKAASRDAQSALYYAKWLSIAGQERKARALLNKAAELGSRDAVELLSMLSSANIASSSAKEQALATGYSQPSNNALHNAATTRCDQKLQIVASTLHSVLQGKELKHRFESDTRLTTLPICINQPIWLSSEALSCSANWQGAARLGCDITQLSHSLSEQDFTHIVVLADTGKANVHNGVMFLDSKDDYNVFVHELAHFAGFVDEYPLSSALASSICHTNNAPNLRVRQGQEKPVIKEWLIQGNKEGVTISPARTCDNHPWQAYKPSQKTTFMEFYDVPYIPKFYLKAWAERLGQKPLLTPAYINLYQGYEAKGDAEQGEYWRTRYQQYLQAD